MNKAIASLQGFDTLYAMNWNGKYYAVFDLTTDIVFRTVRLFVLFGKTGRYWYCDKGGNFGNT